MAYNIGEKPGKGTYVCPNCGCRVGEVTAIARREVRSLGTDTNPHARPTTYTVKNSSPHSGKLKSVTFILILAGLMFSSGFATKALLLNGTSTKYPDGSSPRPNFGDTTSPNVNTGSPAVTSLNANVSVGNPDVMVWVNTNSGVYHCPNTQWYGNTKSGKYMTQKEAQSKGYRPAHGSVCG